MKNVRSSQPCISMNFCTEFSKHKFFPVSIVKMFCNLYNLETLIKEPTCFENPENPTYTDLILSNSYRSFYKSCAIETGLSDFHMMIATVMKSYSHKKESKIIKYRDYSNFCKK